MSEYVERESAIKALMNDAPEQVGYSREDASDCIRYMDAADVAPVRHGRWERVCTYRDETVFRCSNCNREVKVPHGLSKERWAPYCHCGAKMDGGEP